MKAAGKNIRAKISKRVPNEVGRFGLVGILNTLVDIILANILIKFFGVAVVAATLISGTIAMINSFVFNQRFTFKVHKVSTRRSVYFFVITLFGLYIIRPLIIKFFAQQWLAPAHLAYQITHALQMPFSQTFMINNFALAVAIAVVLGYNFFLYRNFVFVAPGLGMNK